jgi:hypothetical protein
MIFKPRIVPMGGDLWAIRTYWFFGWRYVDLRQVNYRWARGSEFFHDCLGDRQTCDRIMYIYFGGIGT